MKNTSKIIALLWLLVLSASESTLVLFSDAEQKFLSVWSFSYQEEDTNEKKHLCTHHAANCQDETTNQHLRFFAKSHRGENNAHENNFFLEKEIGKNWTLAARKCCQKSLLVLHTCFLPICRYLFLMYSILII